MVIVSPGATTQIDIKRAFTEVIDGKGKVVKFEQKKDTNPPVFEGKGTDGNLYMFSLSDALVGITATPTEADNKALRRRNPGIPLPKDEGKKIDEEIKKEDEERQEKAFGGTSPESESMMRRAVLDEKGQSKSREQLEQEKEQEQREKEQQQEQKRRVR